METLILEITKRLRLYFTTTRLTVHFQYSQTINEQEQLKDDLRGLTRVFQECNNNNNNQVEETNNNTIMEPAQKRLKTYCQLNPPTPKTQFGQNIRNFEFLYFTGEYHRSLNDTHVFIGLLNYFFKHLPRLKGFIDDLTSSFDCRTSYVSAKDLKTQSLQVMWVHNFTATTGLNELRPDPNLQQVYIGQEEEGGYVSPRDVVTIANAIISKTYPPPSYNPNLVPNYIMMNIEHGRVFYPKLATKLRFNKVLREYVNQIKALVYMGLKHRLGKDVVLVHIIPQLKFNYWIKRKEISIIGRPLKAQKIIEQYKKIAHEQKMAQEVQSKIDMQNQRIAKIQQEIVQLQNEQHRHREQKVFEQNRLDNMIVKIKNPQSPHWD